MYNEKRAILEKDENCKVITKESSVESDIMESNESEEADPRMLISLLDKTTNPKFQSNAFQTLIKHCQTVQTNLDAESVAKALQWIERSFRRDSEGNMEVLIMLDVPNSLFDILNNDVTTDHLKLQALKVFNNMVAVANPADFQLLMSSTDILDGLVDMIKNDRFGAHVLCQSVWTLENIALDYESDGTYRNDAITMGAIDVVAAKLFTSNKPTRGLVVHAAAALHYLTAQVPFALQVTTQASVLQAADRVMNMSFEAYSVVERAACIYHACTTINNMTKEQFRSRTNVAKSAKVDVRALVETIEWFCREDELVEIKTAAKSINLKALVLTTK